MKSIKPAKNQVKDYIYAHLTQEGGDPCSRYEMCIFESNDFILENMTQHQHHLSATEAPWCSAYRIKVKSRGPAPAPCPPA